MRILIEGIIEDQSLQEPLCDKAFVASAKASQSDII
jgi:hypothetical protein